MKTWTGLKGKDDIKMLATGRTFFVFEILGAEPYLQVRPKEFVGSDEWQGWCAVCAESPEKAIERYHDAHDQWRQTETDRKK